MNITQAYKHPDSYTVLESLADLYLKKSQHAKNLNQQQAEEYQTQAIDYLNQALEIVKNTFPSDSPHNARIQEKQKQLIAQSKNFVQ